MKYTTKLKQAQLVGKVRIEPKGGDLNADQVDEIKKDPWGKDLISKGMLSIEGVNAATVVKEDTGGGKTDGKNEELKSGLK